MPLQPLLARAALAAMLALPGAAVAQQTPAATGAGRPEAGAAGGMSASQRETFMGSQETLRAAADLIDGPQSGQARQSALTALGRIRQMVDQLPEARRNGQAWTNLDTQITEAQRSLSGGRPDPAQARTELQEVLAALSALQGEFGGQGGPPAAGAGGGPAR